MRLEFSVQLPVDRVEAVEEFGTGEAIGEIARVIEDAGFDACFVTEHPFPLPANGAGYARTTGIESLDDLSAGIERMRDYAAMQGRLAPLDVNFMPFGLPMNVPRVQHDDLLHEQFEALDAAGVTWVSLGLPTASRGCFLESVARFAESFLPTESN